MGLLTEQEIKIGKEAVESYPAAFTPLPMALLAKVYGDSFTEDQLRRIAFDTGMFLVTGAKSCIKFAYMTPDEPWDFVAEYLTDVAVSLLDVAVNGS